MEIIPANLSVGNTFYDSYKPANVTVEGEEQKMVAGASRTVTHANDPGKLYKEWDKATGVYVNSLEWTGNYTVVTNAIATNMWSPQTPRDPTVFYALVAGITMLAVSASSSVIVIERRKRRKKL